MSSFAQTIKSFAFTQNINTEMLDSFCVKMKFPFNSPPFFVTIDEDEQYTVFTLLIPPPSHFVSINKIPDNFSKLLMKRNTPHQIGHWIISELQNSQRYAHAFRFVIMYSSLNQQRFNQIVRAMENEFNFFKKIATGNKEAS